MSLLGFSTYPLTPPPESATAILHGRTKATSNFYQKAYLQRRDYTLTKGRRYALIQQFGSIPNWYIYKFGYRCSAEHRVNKHLHLVLQAFCNMQISNSSFWVAISLVCYTYSLTFDLQSSVHLSCRLPGVMWQFCVKIYVGFQVKEELPDSEDENGGKDIKIAEKNWGFEYIYLHELGLRLTV